MGNDIMTEGGKVIALVDSDDVKTGRKRKIKSAKDASIENGKGSVSD